MARRSSSDKLELACSFGGVSFGKKTARVGVTVERNLLSLTKANDHFCDRRLTVAIQAKPMGDQPGQGRLAGMDDDIELEGVADVKGFGVHSTTINFGLTFNAKELKTVAANTGVQFNDFAAREGTLTITSVSAIPEEEKNGEAEEED